MGLLNWFFKKITPVGGNTWLSVRYNRWLHSRLNDRNEGYKEYAHNDTAFFEVSGAGTIGVSNTTTYSTGSAAGFKLSVSWSSSGLGCGGVLGITEAKRLANFILEKCSHVTLTEEEILSSNRKAMYEVLQKLKQQNQ